MRVPRYEHPVFACQYELSEGDTSHLGDREWYAERLGALLSGRAATAAPPRVLEIGAGTGRVTAPLAAAVAEYPGAHLTALDIGHPMLLRLARLAPGAARVCADMTRLPLRAGALAAVLSAYNVLGCLLAREDLDACLASIARALEPGGSFFFDVAVHRAEDHPPGDRRLEWERWTAPDGLEIRRRTTIRHDAERERLELGYEFAWRVPGGEEERRTVPFALNTWTASTYLGALARAGLEVVERVPHTFELRGERQQMWEFVEVVRR